MAEKPLDESGIKDLQDRIAAHMMARCDQLIVDAFLGSPMMTFTNTQAVADAAALTPGALDAMIRQMNTPAPPAPPERHAYEPLMHGLWTDPLGGIRIQPFAFWPTVPDGFETKRIPAHPIVKWLARWLPIDPWVEISVPKFKDADAVLDQANNVIHCSYAQEQELIRSFGSVR